VAVSFGSPPPRPFFSSFSSSRALRDLHSFPTRRSSDLRVLAHACAATESQPALAWNVAVGRALSDWPLVRAALAWLQALAQMGRDRKSTRLNSSHVKISYAVFCLKKKNPRPEKITAALA